MGAGLRVMADARFEGILVDEVSETAVLAVEARG
jgi:hypothetical protein